MTPSLESIRELRREVRLAAERLDGRSGAVSEALERELGLARRWGHLRLLDGSVCWLHCWNESADGSVVDATADQFEELFPGDVLVVAPTDPLAARYLAAPPGRAFDLRLEAGWLWLAVDGVGRGAWPDEMHGWLELAGAVLEAMSPWPQPAAVCTFVADHLRSRGPCRFNKRDLEGPIDVWAWERREALRGEPWLPGDLERDDAGTLRRRANAVEVRPVASGQELGEAIALAVRMIPSLHERSGRGAGYYLSRFPEEADLQIVAMAGERIVGLALASLSPDRASGVVGEVAVHPDYQRRGVGRAMLAELEARAAARGLKRLALGADDDVAGFYIGCRWEPRVQATVRGDGRRGVVRRLCARQLAGRNVSEHQQDEVIHVSVPVDGYDTTLVEQLNAVDGCSAFVMFTKTLLSSGTAG